jgi:hypothetical protein
MLGARGISLCEPRDDIEVGAEFRERARTILLREQHG